MMSQLQTSPLKQQTIQKLRGQIRRAETCSRNDDGTVIPSGCEVIDSMLPAGGYNRGTIVEWFANNGSCADLFSLLAARNAACDGGALVIIDPHGRFYPPAARAIGINLSNLIVLTQCGSGNMEGGISIPHSALSNVSNFLWAIDQSLRCSAVAAVWGELPEFETTQEATHWQRRFQLSAESSGCCGMFIRSLKNKVTSSSSWAEVQWELCPLSSNTASGSGDFRYVRALLSRCRGSAVGQSIDLEINTITGNVQQAQRDHASGKQSSAYSLPLATQLAHPKTGRRAARA